MFFKPAASGPRPRALCSPVGRAESWDLLSADPRLRVPPRSPGALSVCTGPDTFRPSKWELGCSPRPGPPPPSESRSGSFSVTVALGTLLSSVLGCFYNTHNMF